MKKSIYYSILSLTIFSISVFANDNVLNDKETIKSADIVNVIASIEIKEGKLEEFINIFNSNVPNVLAEKGCIEYIPATDIVTDFSAQVRNKNEVTVIEKWASMEDLQAHLSAPHMLEYKKKVINMVSNVTLKVLSAVTK